MMKILLLTFCCIGILRSNGQSQQNSQCGTITPPLEWENWFSSKVNEYKNRNANNRVLTNYTIPVIVHILHNGDPIGQNENISWAQVNSQIEILNKDFSGTNTDIGNAPPIFQPSLAGNTGIQFCLAKTDPDGNLLVEPGVDRINWDEMNWENPESLSLINNESFMAYYNYTIKPTTIWNPEKYLNIWISEKPLLGGLRGFATFPAAFPEYPITEETITTCGVWVYQANWGNIGTVTANILNLNHRLGRIATHEVGHWLGLYHTFETALQTGNSEIPYCLSGSYVGDYCGDTPPQYGSNESCPNFPRISCIEVPDTSDMFMNYMDYTNDQCRIMFTTDQSLRIQTAMSNNFFRIGLNSSTACQDCPELVILNPSLNTYSINAGNNVTANFIERNKGLTDATPNYVNFHLSVDDVLTPGLNGDIYLGQYFVNQTLNPETQTNLINTVINIPSSVAPGTYYLFFEADGTGVVSECVEDNNFATVIITVLGDCPDLIIIDQSASPVSVNAGGTITLEFKERNEGNIQSTSNYVNIHITEDDVLTPGLNGDLYLDQYFINQTLLPSNQTGVLTKQITIPSFISSGSYYIFFAADGSGLINECIENNNFATSVITVTNGGSGGTGSAINSYTYWFDSDFNNRVITSNISSHNYSLQRTISTSGIQQGLHTLNLGFKDGNNKSSIYSSTFFYKANQVYPIGSYKYEYWLDNNYSNLNVNYLANSNNLLVFNDLNASELPIGLHNLSFRFKPDGKHWSSIVSSFFYKAPKLTGNIIKHQYWFDNNFADSVSTIVSETDNLYVINDCNAQSLAPGVHTFYIRFQTINGNWSVIDSTVFEKFVVLPVQLTSFTVTNVNCSTIKLNWQTASEINSKEFVIEQSIDGVNFIDIGSLPAKGNSSIIVNYTFSQNIYSNGRYYIRLKQIDIDGKINYSKIISTDINCLDNKYSVYPNPTKGQVSIIGLTNYAGIQLKLFDINGKLIKMWYTISNNTVSINEFPQGIYILKINSETFKIIKN